MSCIADHMAIQIMGSYHDLTKLEIDLVILHNYTCTLMKFLKKIYFEGEVLKSAWPYTGGRTYTKQINVTIRNATKILQGSRI